MRLLPSWALRFWDSRPRGLRTVLIALGVILITLGLWRVWLAGKAAALVLLGVTAVGGVDIARRRKAGTPAATNTARAAAHQMRRRRYLWRRPTGAQVSAKAAARPVAEPDLPDAGPRPRSRHLPEEASR